MNQICFKHVTKTYPGGILPAVDDCTLEVESGRFVVFLGPSGCGKTTLLKMVNRLIEPTSGNVLLNDVDIRHIDPTRLRRQIGYVIQQVGLFPHMTVAENIAVVPQLLDWPKDKITHRINELLGLVNLPPEEYSHRYPSQLSGGQAQRVGLARALAGDPELMLMDEPFGAIDAIARADLQAEMLHLRAKIKKTILFVTHDVDEALLLADKIAVMRLGKIVQYDTPYRILTEPVDEFVSDLVGAEDVMRRLSLLRVDTVMEPVRQGLEPSNAPVTTSKSNLREALSILLKTDVPALAVVEDNRLVGSIGLGEIRKALSWDGRQRGT